MKCWGNGKLNKDYKVALNIMAYLANKSAEIVHYNSSIESLKKDVSKSFETSLDFAPLFLVLRRS